MTFEQWMIMILAVNAVFTWGMFLRLWARQFASMSIIDAIGNCLGLTTTKVLAKVKEMQDHRDRERRNRNH